MTRRRSCRFYTLRIEFDLDRKGQYKELSPASRKKMKIRSNWTFEIEIVKPGPTPF